jgi:hypothetical protein
MLAGQEQSSEATAAVHYDVTALRAAGMRLGALRERIERSRGLLRDGSGAPDPFGALDTVGGSRRAVSTFQARVHGEFGHLDQSAASPRQLS